MIDWFAKLFAEDEEHTSPAQQQLLILLRECLRECEAIYRSSAHLCADTCPARIDGTREEFIELMIDLHRGLLVKIFIEMAEADRQWHAAERQMGVVLLKHVWGIELDSRQLAQTLKNVAEHAEMLKWKELLKPFLEMPPLREPLDELMISAIRVANLVAKADGTVCPSETAVLRKLQRAFENAKQARSNLSQADTANDELRLDRGLARLVHPRSATRGQQQQAKQPAGDQPAAVSDANSDLSDELTAAQRQQTFDEAKKRLHELVGLQPVKQDIGQLIDFLKMQKARRKHQLPETPVSLHTVFVGNPGTGKTTVARILSHLFCGLEILEKGHLVETDRSGLVAPYAGQTGPRTHERCDEALDGVLFVDEAYSLVSDEGPDAYGVEAIQALLKRMEDDRVRMVVVLAGYPDPMQKMLRSNPGLSSRCQRTFAFPDYSAKELLKIFYLMCKKNHYRLPKPTQRKLLAGFQYLIDVRDEHFGNGRLARNVFEQAICRMASRICDIVPLTRELLTTLEPDDIHFEKVPASVFATSKR